jgi:cellulase/cellobiase CelA1
MTNEDLNQIRVLVREALDGAVVSIGTEMSTRFEEVNGRLDRMDATLTNLGKQVAAGTRAIAGFTEWISKADADYGRVLAELAELKLRVAKLEGGEKQ